MVSRRYGVMALWMTCCGDMESKKFFSFFGRNYFISLFLSFFVKNKNKDKKQ